MEKLPCVNCITLSICKSMYLDCPKLTMETVLIRDQRIRIPMPTKKPMIDEIVAKCTLLEEYLFSTNLPYLPYEDYNLKKQNFCDFMESL